MDYKFLTKNITAADGQECVSCAFFGTEKCQIHNDTLGCGNCKFFQAILKQLNIFEQVYVQTLQGE